MPPANYVLLDQLEGGNTATVINETGLSDAMVYSALQEQHPEVAALTRWTQSMHRGRGVGGLFDRDKYVTPHGVFSQMRTAQHAVENDNIVAGVLETTEALAFSRMTVNCFDEDEEDVWNQVIDDLDLDSRFREMWGELFTYSQFYVATWWGTKSYKVGGRDPKTGVRRKKEYTNLRVPVALTILDPLKVVPVGNMMFNQEQLCYIANRDEGHMITSFIDSNRSDDQIISNLIVGPYEPPDETERVRLAEMGLAQSQLFVLNPEFVWRHTATRPQYKRFADVRMKSVFELLDLKTQLREMDRAHLLGGTNFIVLVTKGTDAVPGKPEEIINLQQQMRTMAKVPVIVGDHRLKIEIITPKLDQTLDEKRHSLIDSKIAVRLFQQFVVSGAQGRTDDSLKMARVVARGLESRRYMLKKAFEREILNKVYDMNDQFKEEPKLVFHPHQIALDFDVDLANYLLDLRDRGDVSRETILAQIDLNEDDEAQKRKEEKKNGYDAVFQTQVPFSTPAAANSPRTGGRTQGGTKGGGGRAPGTGQGQSKATDDEEEE